MWLFSGTTGPSFVIVILPSFYKTVTADCDRGCLPFSRRNRKFRLENQTVRVIPFGKVQKFWAAGRGDAYFLFFLVSSADLATLWNFSFFHEVKLNHLMFVDGFSKRMVCVNGKHLSSLWILPKMCDALQGRQFEFTHSKTSDGAVRMHKTTASSQQNWKILNKQELTLTTITSTRAISFSLANKPIRYFLCCHFICVKSEF